MGTVPVLSENDDDAIPLIIDALSLLDTIPNLSSSDKIMEKISIEQIDLIKARTMIKQQLQNDSSDQE